MWDPSSPTRDQTHVPGIARQIFFFFFARQILNHSITREVPRYSLTKDFFGLVNLEAASFYTILLEIYSSY